MEWKIIFIVIIVGQKPDLPAEDHMNTRQRYFHVIVVHIRTSLKAFSLYIFQNMTNI